MEGRLKQLFDFQKIAKNKHLENIIEDIEAKYNRKSKKNLLSDDDLDIFAAGDVYPEKDCFLEEDKDK